MKGNDYILNAELYPFYDEEEIEGPKCRNKMESLLPLFLYTILTESTNSSRHLRINDLVNRLEEYPYEISVSRKAVSRHLVNICAIYPEIHVSRSEGCWYAKETPLKAA